MERSNGMCDLTRCPSDMLLSSLVLRHQQVPGMTLLGRQLRPGHTTCCSALAALTSSASSPSINFPNSSWLSCCCPPCA